MVNVYLGLSHFRDNVWGKYFFKGHSNVREFENLKL